MIFTAKDFFKELCEASAPILTDFIQLDEYIKALNLVKPYFESFINKLKEYELLELAAFRLSFRQTGDDSVQPIDIQLKFGALILSEISHDDSIESAIEQIYTSIDRIRDSTKSYLPSEKGSYLNEVVKRILLDEDLIQMLTEKRESESDQLHDEIQKIVQAIDEEND